MPKKMVALNVEETSGVDHPAHLTEGWIVMKSADSAAVTQVIDTLTAEVGATEEDGMSESTETTADEAVTDDRIAALEADLAKALEENAALRDEIAKSAPAEDTAEDMLKALPEPVREMLEKAQSEAAEAREALEKAQTAERTREWVEKARAWKNLTLDADSVGTLLREVADSNPDLAAQIAETLGAADATAETGRVFDEIGSAAGEGADALTQIETLAKARVANGESPTVEQAIAAIAAEQPALYTQYLTEKRG